MTESAWNNLEAVAERLGVAELQSIIRDTLSVGYADDQKSGDSGGTPSRPWTVSSLAFPLLMRGRSDNCIHPCSGVAEHYDRIQERRWASGPDALDGRIAALRRVNNWVKAVSHLAAPNYLSLSAMWTWS